MDLTAKVNGFFRGIVGHFENRRQKEEKAAKTPGYKERGEQAIKNGNLPLFKEILSEIQEEGLCSDLKYFEGMDWFIALSMIEDDLDIFGELYGIVGPDYMMKRIRVSRGLGIASCETSSLLLSALSHKAEKISLFLANDPQIDHTKSGSYNGEPYNSPLEHAKEFGMQPVVAVLSRREAARLRQMAGELDVAPIQS